MQVQNYHWIEKPPFPAQINWGHPLAANLVSCILANERAGPPYDLTVGVPGTMGAAAAWGVFSEGIGLNFNGALNSTVTLRGGSTILPSSTVAATLLAMGTITSTVTDRRALSFSPAGATRMALLAGRTANKASAIVRGTGVNPGTLIELVAVTSFSVNRPFTWGVTCQNLDGRLFYDGVQEATSTAVDVANTLQEMDTTAVRISGFDATVNLWSGFIGFVFIWTRALSPAEMLWLAAEPYAFLQPQSPQIRYAFMRNPAAAAAPSLRLRTLFGIGLGLRAAHLVAQYVPLSRRDFFRSWIVRP